MKFIYEHDEQDDFIEIQLTERELKRLMDDTPVECSEPACLHTRRLTNVYIRRMNDAIEEREQPSNNFSKCKERDGKRKKPSPKRSNSHV